MSRKAGIFLLSLVLILTGMGFGQQEVHRTSIWDRSMEEGGRPDGDRFAAGLGVVVAPKPYKGYDDEVFLIPLILYESGNFYARGKNLGYTLMERDVSIFDRQMTWSFDIIGELRFDGYEDDDATIFRGMDDRDWTIEAGLATQIRDRELGFLRFGWLMDILSRHEGHELRLTYGKRFQMDKLGLTPSVGFSWESSEVIDYYYGVRSSEAIVGRPAYSPGADITWFTNLQVTYEIDERWSLFSLVGWEFFGGDVKDSPLVDDDNSFSGIFGFLYEF